MHKETNHTPRRSDRFVAGARRVILRYLVLLPLLGCDAKVAGTPDPPPAAQSSILLEELTVSGASRLSDDAHTQFKEAVESTVVDVLTDRGQVTQRGAAAHTVGGALTFEFLDAPESDEGLVLHLALDLSGEDGFGPYRVMGESWRALDPRGEESEQALQRRAMKETAEELADQLEPGLDALTATAEQLVTALSSSNPGVLLATLREIGRRGDSDGVDRVRALLVHPDTEVVIAALAALGLLGDAESVHAIKDLVTSTDPAKVEHAMYALGALGTEDAIAALEALRAGHASRGVRSLAAEILESVRRRQPSE